MLKIIGALFIVGKLFGWINWGWHTVLIPTYILMFLAVIQAVIEVYRERKI
jgi:hypothetical protein